MVIMYVVLASLFVIREGQDAAFEAFPDGATGLGDYLMQSVTQGLQFGVAVAVILFGVRTILGELVPAFQGIADRVVPGAIPALDAPIVFPYAQNAVLVGFIASFVGGLASLGLLTVWLNPAFGLALILPGLVPHFFTGGAAGVFGNAAGGRMGAMTGGFVNGVLITLLPAGLLGVLGSFGDENTTFGDADFGWFGILVGSGAKLDAALGIVVIALIGLAILGGAVVFQLRVVNAGWDPSPHRERPGADEEEAAEVPSGREYAKIPAPAGAPAPPPPPS
jgi:PTS system ascorbate-specific IIC component